MPRLPTSPTPLRGRVFCGSAVVREGLRTRAQLRSSAWRRLYPDVHASSGLEVTPTPSGPWRSRACCCPRGDQRSECCRAPVARHTVRDSEGRFIARVDFDWPEHRLALEYEGARHGEPHDVARDRARLDRLTAAGWWVVFVTAADVHRPARPLGRLAAARATSRSA